MQRDRLLQEVEVELRSYFGPRNDAMLKVLDGTWHPMADVVREPEVEIAVEVVDG